MAKIEFRNVNKKYNENSIAVKDFTLDIDDNEFTVFVGPSGCGKSTTLRMIAGLESISSGEILIDGEVINEIPPKDRDIAMVFQNYALYPHMNVYDNMAFALVNRKIAREEIDKRIGEAVKLLNLENYIKRKPKELSGGQRQRVALGRAIVRDAKVFLMDEPLSNLDAKLRVQTRSMIVDLYNKLKANFIYVTHDQTEAMTMGTKIVVMKDGIIQQYDKPLNVYTKPRNLFVAGFIGSHQMNFIRGSIYEDEKYYIFENDDSLEVNVFKLKLEKGIYKNLKNYVNSKLILGIRPENMSICDLRTCDLSFKVDSLEILGSDIYAYSLNRKDNISIRANVESNISIGQDLFVNIDFSKINFFNPETELNIDLI